MKEIAEAVAVSRSTVSLWVRDIELNPRQHAALQVRNPAYNGQRSGWAANVERGRLRLRRFQLAGRKRARGSELLFIAGSRIRRVHSAGLARLLTRTVEDRPARE